MTEEIKQERLDKINDKASKHVRDWLKQLENDEELASDDLLASVYGSLIAAVLFGYSPDALANDAKRAAENILKEAKE